MTQQLIDKIFKKTKLDVIEQAFLSQCYKKKDDDEKSEEVERECQEKNFARQKTDFENTIKGLQSENEQIKTKYDKLKAKHIELLQTLLGLEGKNQKLENECQELRKSTQCNNLNAANSEPVLPCFEVDTLIEFVSVFFKKKVSLFKVQIHTD